MTPLFELAGADCERLGDGAFAQPVNAWSSLAFVLAGLWIIALARRAPARRVELVVFGVAVAANAVGGMSFHGLQGPASRWVHDLSILAVLLFIAVFALARILDRPTRWTMAVYGVSLAIAGVVLAALPHSTDVLSAVLAVVVTVLEIADYRHELPTIRTEGLTAKRLARLSVLAALALAGTAFLVGRTGGPWCRPESAFQWHAVWHTLAALAMALYAYGAIEPHPEHGGRSV
jgi:predicted membrane channel-forming protein YqfA (hemolysin III family)